MSTFDIFKKAVRDAYLEKQYLEELPDKLNNPSPANLREYSLVRLVEGLSQDDLKIFKEYFNPLDKHANLETAIEKAELGQLKSIQNFILNITVNPSEKIVKMLAILIDFQKRPYKRVDWEIGCKSDTAREGESTRPKTGDNNTEGKTENRVDDNGDIDNPGQVGNDPSTDDFSIETPPEVKDDGFTPTRGSRPTNEGEPTRPTTGDYSAEGKTRDRLDGDESIEDPVKTGNDPSRNDLSTETPPEVKDDDKKLKPPTDGSSGNSTTAVEPHPGKSTPFVRNKKATYIGIATMFVFIIIMGLYSYMNKECMCWNGERYIEVDCQDNTQANQIIALNRNKLDNFQKIMKPDTLNKEDIGRVWYSKIDNEVEFFTYSGLHPIQTRKALKAASVHIIRTYSGNKDLD